MFWKWTLDKYRRIDAASSFKNYWRVLRIYIPDKADRDFDPFERRDIRNVRRSCPELGKFHADVSTACSISMFLSMSMVSKLCLRRNPVISLDDLYLLLYTHWALDDATYTDERQRVQVARGILAVVFFGCRPCSLFDTRVKFDDAHDPDELVDTTAAVDAMNNRKDPGKVELDRGHRQERHNEDIVMPVDSGCDVDDNVNDSSTTNDQSSNLSNDNGSDSDSDSDSGSINIYDEGSSTDDDCNAGPEMTWTFMYRHFIIIIVANETPGKPNLVFMKATLLHTKGEGNNPQM